METNQEDKNNGQDGDQGKPRATVHERNGKYEVDLTVPLPLSLTSRKRLPSKGGGKAKC